MEIVAKFKKIHVFSCTLNRNKFENIPEFKYLLNIFIKNTNY